MKKSKRSFISVYRAVCNALPTDLAEKLETDSAYWAPEISWMKLTNFVNYRVKKDSNDPTSVKVYAALMGFTPWKMRRIMKKKEL